MRKLIKFSEILFSESMPAVWRISVQQTGGILLLFFGLCLPLERAGAGVKVDQETIDALNAGVRNLHNMELVLKKFFKKPKDYKQIDKDLVRFAKSTKNRDWRFEASGNEIVLKSKGKILFKFKPLSEGKKISDFTFNFNGRKFAINPHRSYSWHKNKLENLLGLSRQSRLETLFIKEAHAFIFAGIMSALTAVGSFIWSKKSQATNAPPIAASPTNGGGTTTAGTGSSPTSRGGTTSGGSSPGGSASSTTTTSPSNCANPEDNSYEKHLEQSNLYHNCIDNQWRIFDPGLGDNKKCTQKDEYCALYLNPDHFKEVEVKLYDNDDQKYPNLVKKGYDKLKTKCQQKRQGEGKSENEAKAICNRPGYMFLDWAPWKPSPRFLGNRLSSIIGRSISTTDDRYIHELPNPKNPESPRQIRFDFGGSFNLTRCHEKLQKTPALRLSSFVKGNKPEESVNWSGGWGMKEKWAKKYCSTAKNLHDACSEAAKRCSDTPATPSPTQPPQEPATGTRSTT